MSVRSRFVLLLAVLVTVVALVVQTSPVERTGRAQESPVAVEPAVFLEFEKGSQVPVVISLVQPDEPTPRLK